MAGINIKIGTISSKFHYPYEGMFGGATEYIIKTLTGNGYIDLTNAVANQLLHLKLYGGTELVSETYIDSVTAEGKCEQRNLPAGYTQYEYLRSSGTQYIDLGYKGNGNTKVEVKFKYHTATSATGSGRVFGSRTSSSSNAFAIGTSSGIVSSSTNKVFWCYDGQSFYVVDDVQFGLDEWKTVIFSAAEHKVDGTTYGDDYNITTFETPSNLMLFAFDNGGTIGIGYVDIAYCKLWDNGVLVRDLIPCKDGSNVIGMYDRVSETLLTNAGTGTFETGNTATPTPTTPMDIISNNGVLKARHQSGLPLGYTLLDYIQSSGSQYIDTLRVPNNNDIIEQKFQKVGTTATTCSWYGSMPSSQTITPRIGIGSFSNQGVATIFAGTNYTGMISEVDTNVHTLRFQATDIQELTYTLDGVTGVIDASTSATPIDMFDPAVELTSYLFARHGTNGVQVYDNEGTKIYYHKEYLANGTLVLNMIPVKRNSDNVLGMYDLVSGQFFTNQGTGDFTAGDPVSDLIEIYTDGTIETIEDELSNTATAEMLLAFGDTKDVQEVLSGSVTRSIGIKVLDGTEDWIKASGYTGIYYCSANGAYYNDETSERIAIPCTHFLGTDAKNTEMANETIKLTAQGSDLTNPLIYIKTTAGNNDLNNFKAWLADQCTNGVPVIVVYPLKTPTTETVAGQFLSKAPVIYTGSISGLTGTTVTSSHTIPTPTQPLKINCNNGVLKLSPNLVDFNETRIDNNTWVTADKTKGFEVNADVYGKSVGNSLFSNANCFGVFVPCKKGQSISVDFFDYAPFYSRCFYCEVTADGKVNTEPDVYASGIAVTQKTFTLTQDDSIGFVLEWYISSTQIRNYTKENYMVVRGTTPPTAYMPYGTIYVDGITETVNIHTKNLFSGTVEQGGLGDSSGAESQSSVRIRSTYIPVKPDTQYNLSWTTNSEMAVNIRNAHFYDASNTWISRLNAFTFTTPPNTAFVRFVWQFSNPNVDITPSDISNIQLELGSTATTYVPYFNGGTATAEILLKVGDYTDEQEILSGIVTRKIGIKVLDGTENWSLLNQANYVYGININNAAGQSSWTEIGGVCSHLVWYTGATPSYTNTPVNSLWFNATRDLRVKTNSNFETLDAWKKFLADQYNAGTPVIVIYPLATPTTESVTGQSLNIQAGSNKVEITQASIDNLPLEVQYKATS